MKKLTAVFAALMCAVTLVSCGGENEVRLEPGAVADILNSTVNFSEELTQLSSSMQLKRYGIDEELVKESAGYAGTQAVVDEIAIFKTDNTDAVMEKVNKRIEAQKESYASYAPDELPKLDNAVIETAGDCVIVCVSEDDSANVKTILSEITK